MSFARVIKIEYDAAARAAHDIRMGEATKRVRGGAGAYDVYTAVRNVDGFSMMGGRAQVGWPREAAP